MEKALHKTLLVVLLLISSLGFSQGGEIINGQLLYHGTNPMPNVLVSLKNPSGAIVAQTVTNSTGNYTFTDVAQGTYTVTFYSGNPAGGVNLSDAFLVMAYLMGVYNFPNQYQAMAADVNGSGIVTWADYLIIMVNYLNQGNPFPIGPWVFEPVPPFTTGSRTGITSGGSSSGDANGNFVPTKESNLIFKEIAVVEKSQRDLDELEMSIRSSDQLRIGGMHLEIRIPEGVSVTDIESPLPEFNYSVTGSELRVTWLDQTFEGFMLNNARPLVTIKAMAESSSGDMNEISLDISDKSHFIGINGEVVSGMHVVLPSLKFKVQESDVILTAYPNPFLDHATLGFQLPEDGKVRIALYDNIGRCVQEIENSLMTAGAHQSVIDGSELVPGMYHYSVSFEGSDAFIKTGTIIKSK